MRPRALIRSKPTCRPRSRPPAKPWDCPSARASWRPCPAGWTPPSSRPCWRGAGYEVVGVTLQLYDHGAAVKQKGACCAGQDIHDARRAADSIGIPHYVLDYESRFRAAVIDDFADAYLRGETPVPCIRCNQTVKFRDLLDVAQGLGAAALATGHYVRRQRVRRGRNCAARPTRRATRATSCSPPPATSWPICAFPSRASTSPRCAAAPTRSAWRWRSSPTARTSASCPRATT